MTDISNILQTAINHDNQTQTLEEVIFEAIAVARETCDLNGSNSANCAVAWDIVEELQAEKAHKKQATKAKTSLESYCDRHPEAVECLIYDL